MKMKHIFRKVVLSACVLLIGIGQVQANVPPPLMITNYIGPNTVSSGIPAKDVSWDIKRNSGSSIITLFCYSGIDINTTSTCRIKKDQNNIVTIDDLGINNTCKLKGTVTGAKLDKKQLDITYPTYVADFLGPYPAPTAAINPDALPRVIGLAYVANQDAFTPANKNISKCNVAYDGSISRCERTPTTPFPNEPTKIAIDTSNSKAYVTTTGAVKLCTLDPTTGGNFGNSCVDTAAGLNNSTAVDIAQNTNYVLVAANSTPGSINRCTADGAGVLTACTNMSPTPNPFDVPSGMRLNEANTKLYVADSGNGRVIICDVNINTPSLSNCVSSLDPKYSKLSDIAVDEVNNRVYFTNGADFFSGTTEFDDKLITCEISNSPGNSLGACKSIDGFDGPKGISLYTLYNKNPKISVATTGSMTDPTAALRTCDIVKPQQGTIDNCSNLTTGFNNPDGVTVIPFL